MTNQQRHSERNEVEPRNLLRMRLPTGDTSTTVGITSTNPSRLSALAVNYRRSLMTPEGQITANKMSENEKLYEGMRKTKLRRGEVVRTNLCVLAP